MLLSIIHPLLSLKAKERLSQFCYIFKFSATGHNVFRRKTTTRCGKKNDKSSERVNWGLHHMSWSSSVIQKLET